VGALIPGLVLQGIGLGIVLTVNDPTGLTAVPPEDSGQAAGMINTAEQLSGALGIATLTAVELGYYYNVLHDKLAAHGITPTRSQVGRVRDFILEAEQRGFSHVPESQLVRAVRADLITGHIDAFQVTFYSTAGIALLGALACFLLVRRTTRIAQWRILSRRSRWIYANEERTPAVAGRGSESRSG
jgi:hypothetical protein